MDAISGIDKVASDGTITHIIGGIYYNGNSDINIEDGVPGDPTYCQIQRHLAL
jgi:hypothetical protein